jgi:UDP-glucose 4-epimerase
MNNRVLITGGAGFVGSYLCKTFESLGFKVFAVDDMSNGVESNIINKVNFEKVDLSTDDIYSKFKDINFEAVIHCAAQSSNALSFQDIKKDLDSNMVSTYNVLNYCKLKKINRFIFTSSLSIYGDVNQFPTPETCTPNPQSYYAINKLSSEKYIRLFSKHANMNYTIFRLYTTYGYGQNLENRNQGLLSIFISYILNNEALIVKGPAERKRDIICVSDVVDAIVKSFNNKCTYDKTYNLGSGKTLTVKNIIDHLVKGLAENPREFLVKYEGSTPGDPFETHADMSLLKSDLDWSPKLMPEEGIKETIEFYKQNI